MLENKTKITFAVITFLILIIVFYRFKQYILDKNFLLDVNALCDTKTEKCFAESADLGFVNGPYKKIEITEKYAPACLEEHTCTDFQCLNIPENKCKITYCSEETKIDGEKCISDQ